MAKRLYVAYGSNLNLRQMKMRCPTAKLVGTGSVENYELQFKGSPSGAFATIGQKDGAATPVAIWDIKPNDERALDMYEGYPSHYYKQDIPVTMESGEEITAMVYIMNQKMNFGVPSQGYYNTVYEGYENCGLDTEVLNNAVDESIERFKALPQQQRQFSLFDYIPDEDESDDYDHDDEEYEDYDSEDYEDEEENELSEDEPDENDPFYFSDGMSL